MRGEGWEMSRFGLVLLVAVLLGISGIQSVGAAEPKEMNTSEKDSKDTLQVMFLDGAGIYSDTTAEQVLLTTAQCGSILTYNESQDGEWFSVTLGDTTGWVNGWFTSFEYSDEYCQIYYPKPQPVTASPSVSYGGSYADTVAAAAATYGVSFDWLWAVVGCESTYNLYAVGAAGEYGPFQFMESTFYSFQALSGIPGHWKNPEAQAYIAAWAFANGHSNHWACA